ncbi:RmlC-like cupin domain-containing protein [Mycena metata]|uniref:RmlC-like cupin domain-containing protein n=1 Tax=Mycena metata TaxID=1033252 RepID=A0AAD7JNJ4_9AGAR|nr:RmlC-like cupin domain-containing protein [Mycena metata]
MQESADDLVKQLGLQRHPEGGYYVETDRQKDVVGTPFIEGDPPRALATSIYYLLARDSPHGYFHMNKSVTYHVHHQGRAEYTLITPRAGGGAPLIERHVVGADVANGESRLLIVGTGVWKMSRLLEKDVQEKPGEAGCLITEVVVPGFHWEDHAFMTKTVFRELMGEGQEAKALEKYVKDA